MTAPSLEVQQKIRDQIRKLLADSGFVAPEMQDQWWAHNLAAFASAVWSAAIEELHAEHSSPDLKVDRSRLRSRS